MCVLIFCTSFVFNFLILRRIQWDTIKMYKDLHIKYLLFLSDFNETWIFLNDLHKIIYQLSNFMKIRPLGAELYHPDRCPNSHD